MKATVDGWAISSSLGRFLTHLKYHAANFIRINIGKATGIIRACETLDYFESKFVCPFLSLLDIIYPETQMVQSLAFFPEEIFVNGLSVNQLDELDLNRPQEKESSLSPVAGNLAIISGSGVVHVSYLEGAEAE
jgi:hypothetical protein